MVHDIDKILLRPGDSVTFEDRDHLLETLDRLDQPVPARHEGRSRDHREHFCMVRYLRLLAGEDLLPLPVTLRKPPKGQDPPDFVLEWPDGRRETFELTDGSTQEYQRRLAAASRAEDEDPLVLPVDINTPEKEAAQLWAEILFSAFLQKAEGLRRGRFDLDHILIYDLTGIGLLLPLQRGAPILRQKVQEWYAREAPVNRFRRISILRDQALLLDVEVEGRILRRESPYFQIPVIRADDEEDLRRRLREIDGYCRQNSIRHLKAFGSILGDRIDDFREDSDLDLLVEFEPGTRVTLLDMARMERELGELTGFKVDLRTAGDLSRYFRQEVLQEAVELRAARG
ncbi:MAG TPA: nucleotidyltransferase domain-containing protein [Thermoanaerobaculia bacterium]|nr:nucleotidyltransferase domain-containing protein [Thermoanaerobaculia bacterium]